MEHSKLRQHTAMPENRKSTATETTTAPFDEMTTKGKIILALIILVVTAFSVWQVRQYFYVTKAVNQFDEMFKLTSDEKFEVKHENGKYITKSGYVFATDPLPKKPEWLSKGNAGLEEESLSVEAMFAGKYRIVSGKYSKSAKEFEALAFWYFSNSGGCSKEIEYEIRNSIAYLNANLHEEK